MQESTSHPSGIKASVRAIACCVLGLASLGCMFALGAIAGLVMAVPSLVLGITAFVQIARNSEKLRGKGLAAIGTSAALVVLGMTVSLLVPNIGPAREEARRMNRRSDLRQIHAAFEDLAMNNGGFVRGALCDGNGGQLLSWRVALLPYLGQESLYREFRLDEPWDSEHNQKLVARMPNIFGRPEDSLGEGMTCYAVPVGPGTLFASKEFGIACRANLEAVNLGDGRSNTVMVVVMPPNRAVLWTKPEEFTVEPLAAWEALRGAREVVVLTCDGAVHTVSDSISSKDFAAALTIAAGDTVPFDMWQE